MDPKKIRAKKSPALAGLLPTFIFWAVEAAQQRCAQMRYPVSRGTRLDLKIGAVSPVRSSAFQRLPLPPGDPAQGRQSTLDAAFSDSDCSPLSPDCVCLCFGIRAFRIDASANQIGFHCLGAPRRKGVIVFISANSVSMARRYNDFKINAFDFFSKIIEFRPAFRFQHAFIKI